MPRLSILPPSAQAWLNSFDSGEASSVSEEKESHNLISTLPDEVLAMILELATLTSDSQGPYCPCKTKHSFAAVKSLALVCRRFHFILVPFFYYSIVLRLPAKLGTGRLYRRLRNNCSIWPFFQVLSVSIGWLDPKKQDEGFWLAEEVISWLTKVRCLSIDGGWNGIREPLNHAFLGHDTVVSMRALTHLTIRNVCLANSLGGLPSLQVLDLQGASIPMKPDTYRTSPITSLFVHDYKDSPKALAQLISWPKTLTNFTFHFNNYSSNPFYMDLPMFRTFLVLHKNTLKTLDIGYLTPSCRGRLFDVSDFKSLEKLKLSRGLMAAALGSPALDADALLAPNLKTFGWDFTTYRNDRETCCNFSDGEETWLRGFLETALARQSTLIRIEITYIAHVWMQNRHDVYPWDRLDAIRDDFQMFGLVLQYDPPEYTRDEWRELGLGSWHYYSEEYGSVDFELEQTELASTDQESTGSESTDSEFRDSDSMSQELKDPEPGRDIREFFFPLPKP